MTEVRPLEVHVVSAHSLQDVKMLGKMHTYVVAWVDPRKKFSTQVEKQGGTSPVWDEKLVIPVHQHLLEEGAKAKLMLEIYTHVLFKEKEVGYVRVPISDLTSKPGEQLDYPVQLPKGGTQGTITISVTLGEKMNIPEAYLPAEKGQIPVAPGTAYPAYDPYSTVPAQQAPYAAPYQYPPQNPPQYYGQYPPPGGYPPQAPVYYSQPAPPPPERSGLGGGGLGGGAAAGAAAGLAGGLVGGFIVGDLVGSASDWGGDDAGDGGGDFGGDGGGGDF